MQRPGLERDVVDPGVYGRTVRRFAEAGIDPDAADPANLLRRVPA